MSERCTCTADGCICDRCAAAIEVELDKQIRKLEVAITGRTVRCERCAELEAERDRLWEAVERIANHGTDLPAAECATEELCDGYRQGIYSCARIARTALKDASDD